jgi:reactive intermediate/imine deaminase
MTTQIINTTNAPAAIGPYSQAIKIGALVFTSGQLGLDPATGELANGIEAQAHQAFKNLDAILKEAGGSLAGVIKFTLFLTDSAPFPARSTIGVASLPKGGLFEIEAIAQIHH